MWPYDLKTFRINTELYFENGLFSGLSSNQDRKMVFAKIGRLVLFEKLWKIGLNLTTSFNGKGESPIFL